MPVLFIKNMVCQRCITTVETILKQQNISFRKVTLGEAELENKPDPEKTEALANDLRAAGFDLIDTKLAVIIEKIKKATVAYLDQGHELKKKKLSQFIASSLHYEYTYLSHLFSSVEGTTIEQYFLLQRIEKVKELLVYDQLSISEIADKLDYSSVHHLSSQFKKMTGLTPSHFKKIGHSRRIPLDSI